MFGPVEPHESTALRRADDRPAPRSMHTYIHIHVFTNEADLMRLVVLPAQHVPVPDDRDARQVGALGLGHLADVVPVRKLGVPVDGYMGVCGRVYV